MSGQWQPHYETCEMCNQKKPDVHERLDPYELDIHGKEVLYTVCDDCNREVAADI